MISTLKGNISILDFDLIVDKNNQKILQMNGVRPHFFF